METKQTGENLSPFIATTFSAGDASEIIMESIGKEIPIDAPSVVDSFLYTWADGWLGDKLKVFLQKPSSYSGPVYGLGLYTTSSYLGADEYEDGVKEQLNMVDPAYSASFDWVRTQDDFTAQKDALMQEAVLQANRRKGSFAGKISDFAGMFLNPMTLAEGLVISKGLGTISEFAKLTAKSLENFAVNTLGQTSLKSLKFIDIAPLEQISAGRKVLKSAAEGASIGAIFSYVDDTGRKYIGLPVEDLGSNMVLNAMLGAILGTGAAALKNYKVLKAEVKERIFNNFRDKDLSEIMNKQVEGSLDYKGLNEAIRGIAPNKLTRKIMNIFPVYKGLTHKDPLIRKVASGYFKHQLPWLDESGISTPVEAEILQWKGLKLDTFNVIEKHVKEFENAGYGSRKDFDRELNLASLNNDHSMNRIISGCATAIRKNMNILLEQALRYKIFDAVPHVKFDMSYWPRMYDVEAIYADPGGWQESVINGLMKQNSKLNYKSAYEIFKGIDETIKGLAVDDLPTILNVQMNIPKKVSVQKGRTVDIASLDLFDYLVHDPYKTMTAYFDGLGFKVAETRVLNDLGFKEFSEIIESFKETRKVGASAKEDLEWKNDLEFLNSIPKIVSGSINRELRLNLGNSWLSTKVNKAIDALDHANVLTLLGGIGLSLIEDVAITASKGQLCQHIGDICRNFVGRNLSVIGKDELIKYGIACDGLLGDVRLLTDTSKIGRLTTKLMKLTGLPQADALRARLLAQRSAIDLSESIMSGKPFETRLNAESIGNIRSQIEKHIIRDDSGLYDLNVASWESFDAKRDFMAEVNRIIGKQVVKPGAGDIPIITKTPIGRMLTMFLGYNMALTTNVLLPLYNSGKFGELCSLIVYGFGFSLLREVIQGKLTNNEYDWRDHKLYEAAIRRMPLGIIGAATDYVMPFINGELKLLDSRDMVYNLAKGGSLRYLIDAYDSFKNLMNNDKMLTEAELRRTIGLIPFNNLFYVQPIMNYAFYPNVVSRNNMKPRKTKKEKFQIESFNSQSFNSQLKKAVGAT